MLAFSSLKTLFRVSFVQKMAENISKTTQMAQRIQDNTYKEIYSVQRQAKLRSKITIESSIDNLQKQLRQQIARSLRNSESKVKILIQKAQKQYDRLIKLNDQISENQKRNFNQLITQCEKVRWEFMVHRQACGFTIKNYELVHSLYKIPSKMI